MTNPYAPPRAAVYDVIDPAAQFVLADRGTRLGAALLDGLIGLGVYSPLLVAAFVSESARRGSAGDGGTPAFIVGGLVLMLVGLVAWAWFTILYVSRNGQTIAKKLLKIKVVRTDGTPISLGRIFWLRNVLNSLIGIVPFYGIVELLFIFGESRQCLHDKIADTMMIRA
jgi:uncharacterized RDD family membrane protein YckC